MQTIKIVTKPHAQQRYDTVGDWHYDEDGNLIIVVSELSDWKRETLIAVHELIEALLCKHEEITQGDVDRFDEAFEKARSPGNNDEPGDDLFAPYRNQHCAATGFERALASMLQVPWREYEQELEQLDFASLRDVENQQKQNKES